MSNALGMADLPDFIGDYKVIRELGRGGMGVVYLAIHPSLGRELALKVMARDLALDPDFLERFRREGEAAAKLRHPNIVQVFDFAHRDGLYFIAMEFLGATTLKDLLQDKGQQPADIACQMLDELLSALASAHAKGIVHRDIKPANVMLTDEGSVALTDFSIAHMKESSKLTQTGAIVGTPEYMAPEQFDGTWDARSDLYAAGIVFYELLTGFSPFRSATMTEVMRKQLLTVPDAPSMVDFTVPEAISLVVCRSLEKDPADRYQSATEMREAIQAALRAPQAFKDEVPTVLGEPVAVISTAPVPVATPVVPVAAPVAPAAQDAPAAPVVEQPVRTPAVPAAPPAPLRNPQVTVPAPPAAVPQPLVPAQDQAPTPVQRPDSRLVPLEPQEWTASSSAKQAEATRRTVGLVISGLCLFLAGGLAIGLTLGGKDDKAAQASPSPTVMAASSPSVPVAKPTPPSQPLAMVPPDPPPVPAGVMKPIAAFPSKAYIAPGIGVGDVGFGVGKGKVRSLWGEPLEGFSKNGMTRWNYGGKGERALCAVFFSKRGVVNMIAVGTPAFTIAGDPTSRYGASYQTIRAAYPNPDFANDMSLNYRKHGLYFGFQDGSCKMLLIYPRGQDLTQLQFF